MTAPFVPSYLPYSDRTEVQNHRKEQLLMIMMDLARKKG